MNARVHGWIASNASIYLSDNCQSGMKVGQSAWRQAAATGCELEERLPLVTRHAQQNVNKALESGTEIKINVLVVIIPKTIYLIASSPVFVVTKFWFSV